MDGKPNPANNLRRYDGQGNLSAFPVAGRIDADEGVRLLAVCERLGLTRSRFVAEAVREKLARAA